jgi:hypothetical protein
MAARSFLGAGKVLADIFVNGAPSGRYISFQEVGKFAITVNSELKEQTSKSREQYGHVVETVAIPQPAEFSMTLREVNREALRMAFMAEMQALNSGSATVSAADITLQRGEFVPVAHRNLAETGFVLTNGAGTTTYVLGTDYDVNWRFGLVRALPGGAIADATTGKVSYTANAISGAKLLGNKQPSMRAKLLFDGVNLVDDLPALATVWEVVLTPSGEVDLMADDWLEVELQGRMKTPVGKASAFEVDMYDAVA